MYVLLYHKTRGLGMYTGHHKRVGDVTEHCGDFFNISETSLYSRIYIYNVHVVPHLFPEGIKHEEFHHKTG